MWYIDPNELEHMYMYRAFWICIHRSENRLYYHLLGNTWIIFPSLLEITCHKKDSFSFEILGILSSGGTFSLILVIHDKGKPKTYRECLGFTGYGAVSIDSVPMIKIYFKAKDIYHLCMTSLRLALWLTLNIYIIFFHIYTLRRESCSKIYKYAKVNQIYVLMF